MKKGIKPREWQGMFVAAAALLLGLGSGLIPESSPASRGRIDTYMHDCISCHGQPSNIRSNDAALDCNKKSRPLTHPRYDADCVDLLAYFEVVRIKRNFEERSNQSNPNRLLQGEILAREYNCFQCHGELGQGGFQNAGALKGYIPGYFGRDFRTLTQGGRADSITAWIRGGIDPALVDHSIKGFLARYFIKRQAVSMPSFATLTEPEIQLLADYLIALNEFGAMDATDLRTYYRRTREAPYIEIARIAH